MKVFDIRLVIGGLFLLYGVVLVVYGLIGGEGANVWTGAAMVVSGGVFVLWQRLRPLTPDPPPSDSAGTPSR